MNTTIHPIEPATGERLRIPSLTQWPVSRPAPRSTVPSSPGSSLARRRGQRIARLTAGLLSSLALLAAVAIFLAIGVGPHIFGYRPVTMLSGSMTPTIRPGDMVIDTPEPLAAIKVGQILTFHTPTASGYVDSHRVTHVRRLPNGTVLIRTKGDANASEDPWHAQLHGHTAWRVRVVVWHLGYLINLLRGSVLHALLLWILPVLLVGWLLAGIWRSPASGEASPS
ncbi:MAG TPA: signal peptidase I [Solirubrobacteraceae bacterium]